MTDVPRPDEPVSGVRALMRSIGSSALRDLITGGLDTLLHSTLDMGPVGNIPVVDWMVKTYDVVKSIREQLYLLKILRFLRGTEGITAEERDAFAARMAADPGYERRVGESVFLLLDRHETADKSELLGRVFKALVRQEISEEEFQRYAFIIDRLFIQDLTHLAQHYERLAAFEAARAAPRERGEHVGLKDYLDEQTIQALFGIGLLDSGGYVETTYHRNDRGAKLIRVLSSP